MTTIKENDHAQLLGIRIIYRGGGAYPRPKQLHGFIACHARLAERDSVFGRCFWGMLFVMLACGLVSGILAEHLSYAQTIMKVFGCSYMLWLAWSLWTSNSVADSPVQGSKHLLLSGCLLQLVNPKLIAYGITAYSVFILPHVRDTTSLIGFALVLAMVGFAGTLVWAICGAGLKNLFQQHPVLINKVLAFTVVGCAVSMAV